MDTNKQVEYNQRVIILFNLKQAIAFNIHLHY